MKSSKIFVALCVICFLGAFSLSAQEYKNFDINGYYTPDIVRNALDLNFNLNDNYSQNRKQSDSISQNNFRWNVNPAFSRYVNTRKNIFSVSAGGKTEGYSQSSTLPIKSKNIDNYVFANLSYSYFLPKKYYASIELRGNYNGIDYYYGNTPSHSSEKWNNFGFNSWIAIGKGRIENVTDARQAVYILESLSQKGSLNRSLSNDEVFRFAQTISKVKNKRFLDARLRKIEEITTVDSFLVTYNLLTAQDARYFTALYDMWDFGGLYQRYSGQSFELGIAPSWVHNKRNSDNNNQIQINTNKTLGRELYLKYRYEKSAGLNWQHSLNASLGFSRNSFFTETEYGQGAQTSQKTSPFVSAFDADYTLSFYPNTRTRFSLNVRQNDTETVYEATTSLPNQDKYTVQFTNYTFLNLNADYYVSQQLRLTGGAGFSYNKVNGNNNTINYSNFGFAIGGGLVYSFF